MASRFQRLAPYLTLILVWAIFFWRFAAPNLADRVAYVPGDFTETFGIFRDLTYRSLLQGRLPVWIECLYAGYPLQADPQAQVFYPLAWVTFSLLRLQGWGHFPIEALTAEVAAHYLLTSLFLYRFLTTLRLGSPASLVGAFTFTYGGYLTGSPPLQTATLETVTWLPLALLGVERLAQTRQPRYLAVSALALAVAFLAGHPQTFVYVALLVCAYLAFQQWPTGNIYRVGAGALGLLAWVGGLSAVQLLPSLEFIVNSTRASVSLAQAGHGFPFEDVVQMVVTGLVSYWNPLYVGLAPLGLALTALARLPRRAARPVIFWGAAALVSLILSFGAKAVAYDVAYWLIPGWRLFRGQEHLALITSFSLALLAAYGAHPLFAALPRPDRQQLRRLLQFGGRCLLLVFVGLMWVTYRAQYGLDPGEFPGRVGLLTLNLGLALLALAVRLHAPRAQHRFAGLLISVLLLDLFAAARSTNLTPAYAPFPNNPLLAPLSTESGFFRIQDDNRLPGHAGCAYGYPSIEGRTPYQIATYAHFIERAPESVRWQLLGVKYFITWRGGLEMPSTVVARSDVPDDKGSVTQVHRLDLEPHRAFVVHQVEVIPGDNAALTRLIAPDFDPLASVILPATVETAPANTPDEIEFLSDTPGYITLRVHAAAPGVLVLSAVHFPNWQVRVNNAPASLLRADTFLLAVALPAGTHEVEFKYRSASLMIGVIISLVSLGLTLLLLTRARLPHRRP